MQPRRDLLPVPFPVAGGTGNRAWVRGMPPVWVPGNAASPCGPGCDSALCLHAVETVTWPHYAVRCPVYLGATAPTLACVPHNARSSQIAITHK